MARKRAQQRWSALLVREVRISRQVQLEGSLWADFVAHANRLHKPAFIAAFEEAPVLACVWPMGGSPCGFCVDLASSDAFTKLGLLHLDHEQGRCRHLRPVEESNALISGMFSITRHSSTSLSQSRMNSRSTCDS